MKKMKIRIKKSKIKVVGMLILIVAAVMLAGSIVSDKIADKKHVEEKNSYYKYYTRFEIEYGDTVSDIYDEVLDLYPDTSIYNRTEYVDEVRSINHLTWDCDIKSGTQIIVPYLDGLKEN